MESDYTFSREKIYLNDKMKCRICLQEKEQSKFYYRKDSQKYRTECKECMKHRVTLYDRNNKIKSNQRKRKWDNENRKKSNKLKMNWKKKNVEAIREYNKLYYSKYTMNRYYNDTFFKLRHLLRSRLNNFLKTKTMSRNKSIKEMIGCDFVELKKHLEKQFKPGMTWENHGKWHIDHIFPLSLANTIEETYKLMHYTNLQPLWARENICKGNKVREQQWD